MDSQRLSGAICVHPFENVLTLFCFVFVIQSKYPWITWRCFSWRYHQEAFRTIGAFPSASLMPFDPRLTPSDPHLTYYTHTLYIQTPTLTYLDLTSLLPARHSLLHTSTPLYPCANLLLASVVGACTFHMCLSLVVYLCLFFAACVCNLVQRRGHLYSSTLRALRQPQPLQH